MIKNILAFSILCLPLYLSGAQSLGSILEPVKLEVAKPVQAKIAPKAKVVEAVKVQEKAAELDFQRKVTLPQKAQATIASFEILKRAAAHLTNVYSLDGEIRLNALNAFKSISIPSQHYEIIFTQLPNNGLSSKFSLSFKVVNGDEEFGSWSIPVHCELWKDVFVTQVPYKRSETLRPETLTLANVDVLRVPGVPVSTYESIEDYEVLRQVQAQKILTTDIVSKKPDVRKGKVVEIVALDGAMRLSTKGVSLQSGMIHDIIKIRNLQSKRDIEGQIINENTVQVYF